MTAENWRGTGWRGTDQRAARIDFRASSELFINPAEHI